MNRVVLSGQVEDEPRLYFTEKRTAVLSFTIFTKDLWINEEGCEQEVTTLHRVVAFGQLAEQSVDCFGKGSQIHLEGRIQTNRCSGRCYAASFAVQIVMELFEVFNQEKKALEEEEACEHDNTCQDELWDDDDWSDYLGCDVEDIENFFENQMC